MRIERAHLCVRDDMYVYLVQKGSKLTLPGGKVNNVGTNAKKAAGKIHTDFERGFIRAEVVAFKDLVECGSHAAAKEKGLVRLEGKEYVVKDGDVILFRFNV